MKQLLRRIILAIFAETDERRELNILAAVFTDLTTFSRCDFMDDSRSEISFRCNFPGNFVEWTESNGVDSAYTIYDAYLQLLRVPSPVGLDRLRGRLILHRPFSSQSFWTRDYFKHARTFVHYDWRRNVSQCCDITLHTMPMHCMIIRDVMCRVQTIDERWI